MRCLLCQNELETGTFRDILYGEDPLCEKCRKQWNRKRTHFQIDGIPVYSSYIYNSAFSACLIQFKELNDEALKDVFLYEEKKFLKRKFKGYTCLLLPSSQEKMKQRGFSHLRLMFAQTGLPVMEPFEKITDISQKEMGKEDRRRMAHGIRLKKGTVLPDRILLCDDTVTTGSTMRGAIACIGKGKHKAAAYAVSVSEMLLHQIEEEKDV